MENLPDINAKTAERQSDDHLLHVSVELIRGSVANFRADRLLVQVANDELGGEDDVERDGDWKPVRHRRNGRISWLRTCLEDDTAEDDIRSLEDVMLEYLGAIAYGYLRGTYFCRRNCPG